MKRMFFISVLFWLCTVSVAWAQPFDRTYYYLGIPFGYPVNLGLQGTFFTPSGWGGVVAYNAYGLKNDADPNTGSHDMYEIDPYDGKDKIDALSFRVLRMFPSPSEWIRYGIEAGPSFVTTQLWKDKYTLDTQKSLGLSLRSCVSFPLLNKFGMELGLQSNLNSERSYLGFDMTMNFGVVKGKPTKPSWL